MRTLNRGPAPPRIGSLGVVLLVSGCNPSPCATSQYWVGDRNYAAITQDCSGIGGSFGRHYSNVPFSELFISNDGGDIGDSVDFTLSLTPGASVTFLTEHLVVGTVLDMDNLAGRGFHDPTNSGALPIQQELTAARMEILKGPREGFTGTEYKVDYAFTIGEPADDRPDGFQRHTGTVWIGFAPSVQLWDSDNPDAFYPPPDAPE